MANLKLARLEVLHRVRDRLVTLSEQHRGGLSAEVVDAYHAQLDRLAGLGESVEDFRITQQDWRPSRVRYERGGLATVYTGPLTGPEP